ncbi:hypothetical protein [uncultured Sphingomonas sp.]|uniref:hypothetical protein n=1 Tax=uncultured Sphingomonas sp. TaxID=158754 RepID=UPI0026070EC9|nr:hypothetical protein [uncultured Sphingomonas sp.]
MKKPLLALLLTVAGLGLGGGAGYATQLLLSPAREAENPVFVPVERLLAPLVDREGRLTGYTRFEIALEVPQAREAFVRARLPLLLHAVNLRTFRTPLASGRDGQLPNIDMIRRVVASAAPEAFGRGVVRRVTITQAVPA